MRKWLKKEQTDPPAPMTERETRQQLALAAGSGFSEHRDLVSQVTENFQLTFDRIGRAHAAGLFQDSGSSAERKTAGEVETPTVKPEGDLSFRVRTEESPWPGTAEPLQKFSETFFKRGNLLASVLAGTGKMMLVSCLKRTWRRKNDQKLFRGGIRKKNVPHHDPDQIVLNQAIASQAVGLVVDTLRDARRVVQSMEELAHGAGEGRDTVESRILRNMYPFLDDDGEKQLLAQYEAQLEKSEDVRERAVLQNALVHTRALLDKKAQMKNEFINKLRFISDRATEALEEFETPGFTDEIMTELMPQEEEIPPATGGNDDPDQPADGQSEDSSGADELFGAQPAAE